MGMEAKEKRKFNPLFFQASLAAGGVALMPFNLLQFSIPHGKGLVKSADMAWRGFTFAQSALYFPLVAIMLLFVLIHFLMTFVLIKDLFRWLATKNEYAGFVGDPFRNVGIFAPITSLAMSANVFWGPVGFFVPQVSSNLQRLMLPSLLFFGVLWILLLTLEFKVMRVWLVHPMEIRKFNFTWLLDVFSFALVSLMGTGIAATSSDLNIASLAAFGSLFTLSIGVFLLMTKLVYLIYIQIKADSLPETSILPAYFTVIPVTCLFGLSFYRILMYMQNYHSIEVKGLAFLLINFAYVITVSWGIFSIYLLRDYFKRDFFRSGFSAPQWGLVCALVGSQVLGIYVNGLYFKHDLLSSINYLSVVLAVVMYFFILVKFQKAHPGQMPKADTAS